MADRHMKRCSTLILIREMQIKTTMKYHPYQSECHHQNFTNNKCWRECREKETLLHGCCCCCCSVTQLCPTLCNPMDSAACQVFLSFTISWSLLKLMSIELMMPSNHLIFCRPLLLLPSIFPKIRVFF